MKWIKKSKDPKGDRTLVYILIWIVLTGGVLFLAATWHHQGRYFYFQPPFLKQAGGWRPLLSSH